MSKMSKNNNKEEFKDFPAQYTFPPFFTIQPNLETRKKQFQTWSSFILAYCKAQKMYILDATDTSLSLFNNQMISRQLSVDDIRIILDDLSSKGQIEWLDPKKKDRCYVLWHSIAEWSDIFYKFAKDNALIGTVETFFSLTNSKSQEFHGMDIQMLIKCLKHLESQGKAEVIGQDGVKFF